MFKDVFSSRHIGPSAAEVATMLETIGVSSLDELIDQTVPASIRLKAPLDIPAGVSEYDYGRHIRGLADRNNVLSSYIGLGYYNCIVPPVIQRNLLENPGWYTAYTPYQAEIAQGRLEGLVNFQTMVMDLTGMELANASLLDEGTAAAEAMLMFQHTMPRASVKRGVNKFFVSEKCFEHTIEVLRARAEPLGIELVIGDHATHTFDDMTFGAMLQYPAHDGSVTDYASFTKQAHAADVQVVVAADLLSLTLLTPPGEWGVDAVVGNSQRFGVPMGYGGPHAAFFASREDFKRHLPGRIIGVSIDRQGQPAYRMALQTREQHIRRDKATSNICTAQALLAIMAGMYAVWHGPKGLQGIGERVHRSARVLAAKLESLGYTQENEVYFDTLRIALPAGVSMDTLRKCALEANINLRYAADFVSISLDETVFAEELNALVDAFAKAAGKTADGGITNEAIEGTANGIGGSLARTSEYLTHPTFHRFRSETEMMRYLKRLENKDVSLTHSMISLGSCTMKLNAASELYPITNPGFAGLHPFCPADQAQGYAAVFKDLEAWLCEITGFDAISFQPNSGAQGEYAGLLVIRAYHKHRGDAHRNIALIPSSAHGTNPASAVMAGMKVVVVKTDEKGNIDVADLRAKAEEHKENLAALMVTYPSTHGVFEESIKEITDIIHNNGGMVYMDGANMNAQAGLTNPGMIGADVCHLNLHKTFAIPHGGGGPGMGPIGVTAALKPFLPGHLHASVGGEHAINAISAAPWGSALILLISYGYIKMLGSEGVTNSTRAAILNANYMKTVLEKHFPVLYQGSNGRIAHEMIVDCRDFKKTAHIEVADIAKRLMDYGFHAPTVSFPVAGTLMIEPTESESLEELDRFCTAMIAIRKEIAAVEAGTADAENNLVGNAPHTATMIAGDWDHPYSREEAAFPLPWTRESKVWPSVARIDNAYGDRNLMCACPPLESYEQASEPQTV